jgi:FkbM family methyltransferase
MDQNDWRKGMKTIPGFEFREDSNADIRAFSEARHDWKLFTFPGEARVLDLGAHIGIFAYFAAPNCRKLLCVEPSRESFNILERNAKLIKTVFPAVEIETLPAAVVQSELNGQKVQLYQKKNSETSDTLLPTRGRVGSSTMGVGILELCKRFLPTTIKCDIECSEYNVIPEILSFSSILEIGIEFHRLQQGDNLERAKAISEAIINNWGGGHVIIKPPVFDKKYWNTVAIYRRNLSSRFRKNNG